MTASVFVTDGRAISSLALARRLDENGLVVHCGESFEPNLTAYSNATAETHRYPSPDEEPEAFKRAVAALIRRQGFDYVIPVRDSSTRLLAELADSLPETTKTLLETPDKIERLANKRLCAKLAAEAGVPVPETYVPDEQGIDHVRATAEFPVLVKPANASGARGIRRVDTPEELPETYRAAKRADGDVIVQEFVDHSGGHYSIGTVFDREGSPRAIHAYEELIQYPDSGGPAIRARSVPIEPWVHEMLELLERVDWTGPAHMDVLFDPADETYKLLEVNPRIWSSIALAIDSGVDIPGVILDIASGIDPGESTTYPTDRAYRWVVPNEILWAIDGWNTPARVRRLFQRDGEQTSYSILSRTDPGAVVGAALQSARFMLESDKRAEVFGRGWRAESDEPRSDEAPARRDERQHL